MLPIDLFTQPSVAVTPHHQQGHPVVVALRDLQDALRDTLPRDGSVSPVTMDLAEKVALVVVVGGLVGVVVSTLTCAAVLSLRRGLSSLQIQKARWQ